MSKLTIAALMKDLSMASDNDKEASERQNRMKNIKDQVLAGVEEASEGKEPVQGGEVKKVTVT